MSRTIPSAFKTIITAAAQTIFSIAVLLAMLLAASCSGGDEPAPGDTTAPVITVVNQQVDVSGGKQVSVK